ncbi:hypothetical protein EASAB2608_03379 [Streptomyces sp. EAS-AB2608]|nr:hypothetical protein EASAB2608_03379 [Streptomyces sp. EAS-AB2608]
MVEDLDDLVVGAGLRQEFRGGGERLARPRGRAETVRGIGLEQRGDDLPERFRNAPGRAGRPVFQEVLHERFGVGLRALQQVQGDQADREQVGGEVGFGAHDLLGGEVTGRAHHEVGLRQPGVTEPHGDPEVGQPQPRPAGTGGFEEQVGGLDVPVDDVLRVDGREPGQQLVEQGAHVRRRERAVVADQVDQGAAGDQVHGEQHLVVVRGPAGRGEDVRVVDPQGLLAHEAEQGVGVALLEDLGGHVTPSAMVPGTPYGAHATASDRVGQLVPAGEDLTHGSRRSSPGPTNPPRPGRRRSLLPTHEASATPPVSPDCQFWWDW